MATPKPAEVQALIEASTKLALSMIGRISHCSGRICSSCHQQAMTSEMDINHNPTCLVGQLLDAIATAFPAARPRRTTRPRTEAA